MVPAAKIGPSSRCGVIRASTLPLCGVPAAAFSTTMLALSEGTACAAMEAKKSLRIIVRIILRGEPLGCQPNAARWRHHHSFSFEVDDSGQNGSTDWLSLLGNRVVFASGVRVSSMGLPI